jgi:hypothetical protein
MDKDQIRRFLLSRPKLQDILRVVNFGPGEAWTFEWTFDSLNRNNLTIAAALRNPPKISELIRYCPFVLECRELNYFSGGERQIIADVSHQLKTENSWEILTEPSQLGQMRLVLFDVCKPAYMANYESIDRLLRTNTWIGSLLYAGKTVRLRIIDGGNVQDFTPRQAAPIGFLSKTIISRGPSDISFVIHAQSGTGSKCRHACFGELPHLTSLNPPPVALRTDMRFTVEFVDNRIQFFHELEPLPADVLADIKKRLDVQVFPSILDSVAFKNFQDRERRAAREQSARKLHRRKDRVEQAEKIFVAGQAVFQVPSNENETVCLFMKLEGLKCLPLDINLLEYTPRDGIDAIGHFRRTKTASQTRYACIEFEHSLESYLDHGHPAEQTDLIICWDYDAYALETHEIEAHKIDEWWIELKFPEKTVPALILSRIPVLNP